MTVKLLIALMTVALVVSLWMVVFSVVRAHDSDVRQFRDTMQISADLVALNSKPALLFRDERGARENLAAFRAVPAIISAQIVSADGAVFVAYRQGAGSELPSGARRGDPERLVTVSDIRDGDETLGTLVVLSDTAAIRRQLVDNLTRVGSAGAIAIVIALLLTVYFRRQLVTPILSLADSALFVAQGRELSQPIPVSGNDELGKLIRAFNLMMAQLRQRDEKLQHYNAELEREVESRTAELVSAKKTAEEASRVKSDFLAIMSHEIRTPLNAVLGFAGLLRDATLSPEHSRWADAICTSGDALLHLVDDILDYTKIETGQVSLNAEPVALAAVVESMAEVFRPQAVKKHLEFGISIRPAVPPFIRIDPRRLRQVLAILVGNAVKFTRTGSVRVVVDAEIDPPAPGSAPRSILRFAVADTGIGIPADARDRLFKPFSQVDSSMSRSYGGTGLGLAIAQRLVRLLGGEIGCESEPGHGSVFHFSLPVEIVVLETRSAAAGRAGGIPAPGLDPTLRLLIAKDDATSRRRMLDFFSDRGLYPDIVDNGAAALAAANARRYDFILLDVELPELDGYAVARAVRAHHGAASAPRLVALVRADTPPDRARCTAAGFDQVLAKPVEFPLLERLLATRAG